MMEHICLHLTQRVETGSQFNSNREGKEALFALRTLSYYFHVWSSTLD
jgi:hypothetical protein